MRPRGQHRPTRCGVTLLEVMLAVSLSAVMMTSSFVVLRSSVTAWRSHEADLDRSTQATALLRHFTRAARQARGVAAISAASDTSGSITLMTAAGSTLAWDHSGTSVTLSVDAGAAQSAADDIRELSFEGYEADAVTPTTATDDIQLVRVVATTDQPAGGTRTISSYVWLRSW